MAIKLKMTADAFGYIVLVTLPDGSELEIFTEFSEAFPRDSIIDSTEVYIDFADAADTFTSEPLPTGIVGCVLIVLRRNGHFVSCALWGPDGFIDTFGSLSKAIEVAEEDYNRRYGRTI